MTGYERLSLTELDLLFDNEDKDRPFDEMPNYPPLSSGEKAPRRLFKEELNKKFPDCEENTYEKLVDYNLKITRFVIDKILDCVRPGAKK